MDELIDQFAGTIRAAAASGTPLCIRGGSSKDFYGGPLRGDPLEVGGYRGIVDYEPTELVITARAGTPLAEVEAALDAHGQMLAFEPPHFGPHATLGGCIAAGLSGPRRAYAGAARDFVLGVRMLDGRGSDLRFGGRVMKNVAGFDLSRLMAGSLGTLGVLLEVSLKVLPRPAAETTLCLEATQDQAITLANTWAGRPLPLSASAWHDGRLSVRLSGAHAAVTAAARLLGGERLDQDTAARHWRGLREQTDPFFNSSRPLWRLSIKPTTTPLALPGAQLLEWGGALRWFAGDAGADTLRAAAAAAGGHATLFRGGDKSGGVFHPLPPALMAIQRNLRHTFDPSGIFNPGRLYAWG